MTDTEHDDTREPLRPEDAQSEPQPIDPGLTGGIGDGGVAAGHEPGGQARIDAPQPAPVAPRPAARRTRSRRRVRPEEVTQRGAGDNQFGVKTGDIRKLAKEIKVDHELGLSLWETGNADAQMLAILLVRPNELSARQLSTMAKEGTCEWVAVWLSSYVIGKHPDKESVREKWMKSKDAMTARAGWSLTAQRVVKSPDGLDLDALLDRLEKEMPKAPPQAQWTMNTCLGEIGIHHAEHRDRALAIGEALGIYRDYPVSKGCTSPFVPIWVNEMVSRQKA